MLKNINVSLIGNPNTGKTSVFNLLTGLNQQVGNYPGITVERKAGICKLPRGVKGHILDLPGTYSLNATSLDENVVCDILLDKNDPDFPDVVVVVSDVINLKRNLLIFTQIKDLCLPTILAINMSDQMQQEGIEINIPDLEKELKTKIVLLSSRKNEGIEALKEAILSYQNLDLAPCLDTTTIDKPYFENLQQAFPDQLLYKLWLIITQDANFSNIQKNTIKDKGEFFTKNKNELKKLQQKETIKRYQFITRALKETTTVNKAEAKGLRARLDRVLMHPILGYLIFFGLLLFIFQAIYDWSGIPMDFIDESFVNLSEYVSQKLPNGVLTDLITEGIIPGLSGVFIFVPQIMFLFFFISILEETGYMSRVVFLMDRILRKFGLSGKSVVPLISGTACSIPAVMASRNIENWKQRLITILVVPFTTCAARLPVYAVLIALVIPENKLFGLFSYQSLTLMGLYLLGFLSALLGAWILNGYLKVESKSFFVVEMPAYKLPLLKNIALNLCEKTKSFVLEAGKIILAISIILWVLASYGPGDAFENAETIVKTENTTLNKEELAREISSYQLEHSYIGYMGKGIEPLVAPLGYDWKIGVALISSFAAREIFVGSLATIYSVGEEEETIKNKMKAEINPITGGKRFDLATGISLLLFYAFAMQCLSTVAIVKKETNSWKWPILQLVIMTAIAYGSALIAYQVLV